MDVTVRSLDDFPSLGRGAFVRVREGLGVTSFGINVERWPPHSRDHPEHDERRSRQEELYTLREGSATLLGGDAEFDLRPGVVAPVVPAERPRIVAGPEGVVLLCLGVVVGWVFMPSALVR